MKEKGRINQPIHAGIGTTSVILIFLVLSLAAFSVLSLVSARNSETLTQKNTEYVTAYYNAASLANNFIAKKSLAGIPGTYVELFNINDEMDLKTEFCIDELGALEIMSFCVISAAAEDFIDFE